jgi:hypothetical protein
MRKHDLGRQARMSRAAGPKPPSLANIHGGDSRTDAACITDLTGILDRAD